MINYSRNVFMEYFADGSFIGDTVEYKKTILLHRIADEAAISEIFDRRVFCCNFFLCISYYGATVYLLNDKS